MSTTALNTTSTGETATGERSRSTARVAVAAILAYWALSIAVAIVNSKWNPLTRQLSEYALGRHGWLQVAAFLASAVAYGAIVIAVWGQVRGLAGRIGSVILSYCALGSIGVGVFVTDPMTTPSNALSTHGVLHTAFGGSALILLPAAALLITRSIAQRHSAVSRDRRLLRRVAYLPLAGLALIWIPEIGGVIPIGGWPDRILFLTYTIWLLTLATHATFGNDKTGER
jgi:Protein of unknown function (DUF998)